MILPQTASAPPPEAAALDSLHSFNSSPVGWPAPLAKEARIGLVGEMLDAIEPHTEGDPAGLVFSFLTTFGNVAGPVAHFRAEADKHYPRLFCCFVGKTSKGRKGSMQGHTRRLFTIAAPDWQGERNGLSSGEGLIWAVRDATEATGDEKLDAKLDRGVEDKRLLPIESEFASVLRVLGREGNTLSAVLRAAWDSGTLQTMTKNSAAKATDAHISAIGHITKQELVKYLNSTESCNGLGNRFLWVCVERSKLLPEGGNLSEDALVPLARKVGDALYFAQGQGEIRRDAAARELWADVYEELSEGRPGLLGAITGRAEAQTMRLALIYALLDHSPVIAEKHLLAGLACWDYSFSSARYIFGSATGDTVADEITRALKSHPEGMTRTEVSDLFGRNQSTERIGQALDTLLRDNRIIITSDRVGQGRHADRILSA